MTTRRRRGPHTLRGRLALVALAAMACLMGALTVVVNALVQQRLQHQADDHLRTLAAAVATTVEYRGDGVHVLETPNDGPLDANAWIFSRTHLVERPSSASARSPVTGAARELAARGGRSCTTLSGGPTRLCTLPVTGEGRGSTDASVVTALDLTPYRTSADTVLTASLVLDVMVLLSTYLLTRLTVGRALRPVRTMTQQAARWSVLASNQRFGTPSAPAELAGLGTSLDALLDRTRTLMRHEQQLTRELSHELRNPLARIIAELDWWASRPRTAQETRAAQEAVAGAARSMQEICDTLLQDARDSTVSNPASAEVLPVLRSLTARLERPLTVSVAVGVLGAHDTLSVGVGPALLERAVSPLLDNAVRHAASAVTVVATARQGHVLIEVSDDGSGVPPHFTGDLFSPGHRADPSDGHSGAGLGLPLARRLARSAGGEVHYDTEHPYGARFVVTLPAG